MTILKLALDWTPNVNHVGFFVAKAKGFYKANGIDLDIISPGADNYATTPAKKVEHGLADFALCPTESLISYQTKSKPFQLVGVSSIFQEDLSAISVLKSSGIRTPKALDDKIYASYKARYEDGIVKQMIKNDGGEGNLKISYPDKLGIWNRLVKGDAEATWIFLNWEALQADAEGIALNHFKLADYGIPYSYSSVIAGHREKLNDDKQLISNFIEATKSGFFYAKDHRDEASDLLNQHIPDEDQNIDLVKSITLSCDALGTKDNWGIMNTRKIDTFLNWLRDHDLEHSKIKASDIIF